MTTSDVNVSGSASQVATPGKPRDGPRVCAIVVVYHPEPGLLREVIAAAIDEADTVLVIDNTEGGGATHDPLSSRLDEGDAGTRFEHRQVQWVQNGTNTGLSRAYNQGLSWALAKEYDFVLLLDQDSILTKGVRQRLLSTYDYLARESHVGSVSAQNVEMEPIDFPVSRVAGVGLLSERLRPQSTRLREILARLDVEELSVFTNSGTLLPLSVFRQCGQFNSHLFLNAVDFDISLALRSHGLHLYRCRKVEVKHRLSAREELNLLGLRLPVRVSAPWRSYLQIRDTILFAKRWWLRFPRDVFRVLGETLVTTFGMLVLLDKRLARLGWVFRGVSDAINGSPPRIGDLAEVR